MDIFKTALDFAKSDLGLRIEIISVSTVISHQVYKKVSAKMGVFIREQLEGLKSALQIQSTVVDGHTKKLEDHDEKLKNHETRIGVLEKPKP